jgi:hypothetical protein
MRVVDRTDAIGDRSDEFVASKSGPFSHSESLFTRIERVLDAKAP